VTDAPAINGYKWTDAAATSAHAYTLPSVMRIIDDLNLEGASRRVVDIGCGNGAVLNILHNRGYSATGVDPSEEGVNQAHIAYPHLRVEVGSAYDDLAARFGQFPIVISLDVVEHCFFPRKYARTLYDLLEEGGTAILSTPYHGYWKNLALALSGSMDRHYTALWDYGHIKFWSMKTLRMLLEEVGFKSIQFARLGRIPPFAKTMVVSARR
jgi:2-polyprenyl-3-methyl-5-hydroxy-6-metoxy-1,4-benzoquinol methylase